MASEPKFSLVGKEATLRYHLEEAKPPTYVCRFGHEGTDIALDATGSSGRRMIICLVCLAERYPAFEMKGGK